MGVKLKVRVCDPEEGVTFLLIIQFIGLIQKALLPVVIISYK